MLHQAISTIDVLLPIAKAIPGVGGSLEGALEATRAILKYSKVGFQTLIRFYLSMDHKGGEGE